MNWFDEPGPYGYGTSGVIMQRTTKVTRQVKYKWVDQWFMEYNTRPRANVSSTGSYSFYVESSSRDAVIEYLNKRKNQ